MKEIVEEVERWRDRGEKVAIATVVATRRSAPRPVGAKFAVSGLRAPSSGVSRVSRVPKANVSTPRPEPRAACR